MTIHDNISSLLEKHIPDQREREHVALVIMGIFEKGVIGEDQDPEWYGGGSLTGPNQFVIERNDLKEEQRKSLWEGQENE